MKPQKRPYTEKEDEFIVFDVRDEYPGTNMGARWIIASDLPLNLLLAKYDHIKKYAPCISITLEEGLTIYECNHKESLLDRTVRKHCISLDALSFEGEAFGHLDSNLRALYEETENERCSKMILAAIAKLKPAQSALIDALYNKGMTQEEYAKVLGITRQAVGQRLGTAKNNLEKILGKPFVWPSEKTV